RIPELEKRLDLAAQVEMQDMRLLRHKVTENEIADVLARWTGIPVAKMLEGDREKLLRMESKLHKRVVGQHEAVNSVSNAIRRSRAGLSDPDKPIGSFMFLGPTGVGKTELTKALASFMFDTHEAMVRLDMSEYMEKHAVARLIGAPPGYVGYDEGGYLTEAVRRKPYSVLLFDEIEKAHPDVFNILLQVLDDGRLTDGKGRTVDFKNTVIIMTSNLGSELIQEMFDRQSEISGQVNTKEQDHEKIKDMVMEVVAQHFRPEFINRVDEVVVFHPLTAEQIKSIASIQLKGLKARLEGKGYKLHITEPALKMLSEVGFDPVFGARPLKRAIQQYVENPLAQAILANKIDANSTLLLDCQDGELKIKKQAPGNKV
ncbi:MAG: ATP-dependent Clp protease ATP-binding subunit ClpB, partial [Alteromonadaceae bacterium]